MAGVKGRSGRKRVPGKAISMALDRVAERDLPEIIAKLVEKAKNGDKDCAIYILDRVLGRPHQSIDARIKGDIEVNADKLRLAIEKAAEYQRITLERVVLPQIEGNLQLSDGDGIMDGKEG